MLVYVVLYGAYSIVKRTKTKNCQKKKQKKANTRKRLSFGSSHLLLVVTIILSLCVCMRESPILKSMASVKHYARFCYSLEFNVHDFMHVCVYVCEWVSLSFTTVNIFIHTMSIYATITAFNFHNQLFLFQYSIVAHDDCLNEFLLFQTNGWKTEKGERLHFKHLLVLPLYLL